jgi:hypothetical protein
VLGQPAAERAAVELGVIGVQRTQCPGAKRRTQALTEAQLAVAQQRAREVQRRRQPRRATQHVHAPVGAHHGDLKAPLQPHATIAAKAIEQRPIGVKAAQEDVLAVVERQPLALE